MQCTSCHAAETKPRIDLFTAGCESCQARAVAALALHVESEESTPPQMTVQYRGVLKKMFGDRAREGHAQVLDWAARMKAEDTRKAAWGTRR